ncbi:MAG TPA: hypothetical protein VKJ00_08650, partial [Thermoanaerobaculia bacterium]|nr:hypothetical protein [Thermoanaerobaculia bacterium]
RAPRTRASTQGIEPFATRPSLADWIRETTRVAGTGAEFVDQAGRRGRIRPSGLPVRPGAQIDELRAGDG